MAVLMIGATERERIAEVIAFAKANPVRFDVDELVEKVPQNTNALRLTDRPPGMERPPSQNVIFSFGLRAAFSVEDQPVGLCTHLSISIDEGPHRGKLPNPHVVAFIAEAFSVPFPADKMWPEEFDPGAWAINLLSLFKPKEGNA